MWSLRTSLPVPIQPWEAAKATSLVDLSLEEQMRFYNATLENLFYDASVTQEKHAQNNRSWLIQERLSSLVDAISDYDKALDIYSNTYGLILCPIWGGLRVVFHVSKISYVHICAYLFEKPRVVQALQTTSSGSLHCPRIVYFGASF